MIMLSMFGDGATSAATERPKRLLAVTGYRQHDRQDRMRRHDRMRHHIIARSALQLSNRFAPGFQQRRMPGAHYSILVKDVKTNNIYNRLKLITN